MNDIIWTILYCIMIRALRVTYLSWKKLLFFSDAASRGIHFTERGAKIITFSPGNSSLGYNNCSNDYASEIGPGFERSVTHTLSLRVINQQNEINKMIKWSTKCAYMSLIIPALAINTVCFSPCNKQFDAKSLNWWLPENGTENLVPFLTPDDYTCHNHDTLIIV